MTQVTNKLQSLIFGDRSTFIINHVSISNDTERPSQEKVIKLLHKMESKGYVPTNPCVLFTAGKEELKKFKEDFTALVDNSTKEGRVIRTTFFDTSYPTDYTSEEWTAIMAQYAITYGWRDQYNEITGNNATAILQEYVSKFTNKKIILTKNKVKKFTIGTSQADLHSIIKNIISSKATLRTQQIAVLKECPKSVLIQASNGTRVPIKETLVLLMKLLRGQVLQFPLLQTAQDVLRYIVSVHAEEPLEGQLNKTLLKDCKIHIPTSDRKMLLNNLELIARKRKKNGSQFLCEDMFSYEAYWKIINKYLQYEKYEKTRIKYPLYTGAIDLLYQNDRSWTFNGRYSAAKEEMDYAKAIEIAAERPGFMLKNMMEFMRMATGVKMPKKKNTKLPSVTRTTQPANNPFANKLASKKTKAPKYIVKPDSVITDASNFFDGPVFGAICKNKLNTKLAFQLMEQTEEPRNNKPQTTRIVQDITVHYEIPIPALNTNMKKIVLEQLKKAIKFKLREKNNYIKSVYIDNDVAEYSLQYSGHDSTEISYSGEFMAKNSTIPFSELSKKNPIIRLGVMWRAKPGRHDSIDIDHNVTLIGGRNNSTDVYYGNRIYKDNHDVVAASSSGDITSCGNSTSAFSTEIVDLDVARLKADGITNLYNSFINYHGGLSIGSLECYTFMQILSKSKLAVGENRTRVKVDLAKMDYAIQIDPNNTDQTGSYIGLHFDLQNDCVEVLAIPVRNSGNGYSNVRTNATAFFKAIESRVQPYLLGDALELAFNTKQLHTTPETAEVIITRKTREDINASDNALILHPGKDSELINEYIFA